MVGAEGIPAFDVFVCVRVTGSGPPKGLPVLSVAWPWGIKHRAGHCHQGQAIADVVCQCHYRAGQVVRCILGCVHTLVSCSGARAAHVS
eukprot:352616-Chlamydomonas_euryale.AAC.7